MVLPCACSLVIRLHSLVYLGIDTNTLSLCWRSTVTFVIFRSEEARPRGPTTVTNTEDYQPQGTDFRVEYLYCGCLATVCLSAPAQLSPTLDSQYV
jgi:hypothetical protein